MFRRDYMFSYELLRYVITLSSFSKAVWKHSCFILHLFCRHSRWSCLTVCAKVKELWRKRHDKGTFSQQTCGTKQEKVWPGVQRVSKPATTAIMLRRLPAAPRPSAAELCQTQPTLWGTATGGTPAWAETGWGGERVREMNQKCLRKWETQKKNFKIIFCCQ